MGKWICFVAMLTMLVGCGQPLQIARPSTTGDAQLSTPRLPTVAPFGTLPTSSGADITGTNTAESTPAESTVAPTQSMPTFVPTDAPPAATVPLTSTAAPTVAARPSVVIVPQFGSTSNEERWRAQQAERAVLPAITTYVAREPVELYWYDPIGGISLPVGTLLGRFSVQATFTFRPANAAALEVPYKIDAWYGLTAIAPSVRQRMAAAGYTEYVETYVLLSDSIAAQ